MCIRDRSFYTASKQVRTPNDLKGLKIRTIASPVMVDTINAFGATATPMGFGDLYLGLKSGIVDGAENAPDAIWYAKHYDCLLYTSDAADERSSVDLGGRRI